MLTFYLEFIRFFFALQAQQDTQILAVRIARVTPVRACAHLHCHTQLHRETFLQMSQAIFGTQANLGLQKSLPQFIQHF